ncbi:prepilin peptidase [Roseomonas chloroacetimidivorans]|uniref:prepilin peptidase n=1 Tax=Roseomonas chloroacetimidivorans TaxID=1766656 RepID=UPI003C777709
MPWIEALWALCIALADLRNRRISNRALLLGCAMAVVQSATRSGHDPGAMITSGLAGGLSLLPAWRLRLLGGGDVKLAAVAGLLEPAAFLPALVIALLSAVLIGTVRRLRSTGEGKAVGPDLGRGIPFAPLLLGPLLAVAIFAS